MTLLQKFFNSSLYYHVYYKHTKKHKTLLKETSDRAYDIRKKIIGK